MPLSTWMLCGVSTTVTSGDAAAKRRPSSSIAPRVFVASARSSGLHHASIAMLPCGAIAAKTSPTYGWSRRPSQEKAIAGSRSAAGTHMKGGRSPSPSVIVADPRF